MYGFLAYATSANSVREFVGCAMSFTASGVRDEVLPMLRSRLLPGEALNVTVLVSPQGVGPVRGSTLMEIERRAGLSIVEYATTYVDPTFGQDLSSFR